MRGKATNQAADFYNWVKKEKGTVNCKEIITQHGGGKYYDFNDPKQANTEEDGNEEDASDSVATGRLGEGNHLNVVI